MRYLSCTNVLLLKLPFSEITVNYYFVWILYEFIVLLVTPIESKNDVIQRVGDAKPMVRGGVGIG